MHGAETFPSAQPHDTLSRTASAKPPVYD